ncbi:CGNR zinc finger domain-containing protein [Nitriliruptor alkaliphilus]|uniref:CGNR zinc finger domain-containing protein n=1 Tax=Nitriliruptor alkaliphilus TaxID=427918 RepID=UPI00069860FB|nr:CGNR zinc finger domain-containing protein [Nitriliruptor alkaliphilus]
MPFDADDRSAALAVLLVEAARDGVDAAELHRRFREGEHHLPVATSHHPAVLALGAELDALFGGDPDATVAAVDAALARLSVRPRLSTHDGRPPHLHYERDGADVVERLRVNVTIGLARVVATDGPDRLGRCAATGCRRVFVDTSRGARRRFCTAACANRTHVADHRARRRADRGGRP